MTNLVTLCLIGAAYAASDAELRLRSIKAQKLSRLPRPKVVRLQTDIQSIYRNDPDWQTLKNPFVDGIVGPITRSWLNRFRTDDSLRQASRSSQAPHAPMVDTSHVEAAPVVSPQQDTSASATVPPQAVAPREAEPVPVPKVIEPPLPPVVAAVPEARAETATPQPAAPIPPQEQKRTSKERLWPWAVGGAVLAGGATAAVLLLTNKTSTTTPAAPSAPGDGRFGVSW